MRSKQVNIRKIDNSQVIVIPNVLRKGWAEAANRIAAAGDDALILGELENETDSQFEWSRRAKLGE